MWSVDSRRSREVDEDKMLPTARMPYSLNLGTRILFIYADILLNERDVYLVVYATSMS